MNNFGLGTGKTPVNTKLNFNVMANPFGIKKLTEKEAIELIKNEGLKFRRVKLYGKVVSIKPVGNEETIYEFIEKLMDQKIFVSDNAITIK